MKSLIIFCFVIVVLSSPASAAVLSVPAVAGGDATIEVVSLQEIRFKSTIRQQYDFSCGSAALATLLSFHYRDPLGEPEVFKAMYDAGDKEKIKKEGFSMLDMKNFLHERGYSADGFRIPLNTLARVGVPGIVLIDFKGYRHFVVIKGVNNEEVLLGDPSYGSRRLPRDQFLSMWNGLLFLIRNKFDIAKRHFNQQEAWQLHARAPLGRALDSSELANVTWLLLGNNEF